MIISKLIAMGRAMKLHSLLLLTIVLATTMRSAQGAAQNRYICPEQTEIRSETPFTLDELETLLGFHTPGLDDLINLPAYTYQPEPYYFFYLSCTPQNDTTFVALLYPISQVQMRLRVFQLQADQVVVEASLDDVQNGWLPHWMRVSGFADRNFNGRPDLSVRGEDGTKGWYSGMRIVELGDDHALHDITPVGGSIGPDDFDDIDGDGIPELHNAEYFFVPTTTNVSAAVQVMHQWWAWNSAGYRTVAVEVPAFPRSEPSYWSTELDSGDRIRDYLDALTPEEICTQIAEETPAFGDLREHLFDITLYFDTWGDLDTGQALIQPILMSAEACPESDGKQIFMIMRDVLTSYFDDAS